MTLESTTSQNRYVGNGATTVFPFTFKVWKTDQVAVYVGDGYAEQDVAASCSIGITQSGGTVTFPVAPETGVVIVIKRSMPYIQEDDYRNGTRFDAEEIEDRLDQDCAERQDLKRECDRCMKIPATSDKTPEQYLDEVASLRVSVDSIMDALNAIGSGVCGSGTVVIAAGGTAPISLGVRFGDQLTPEDFGAKGDGETDDTAAFTALEAVCTDVRINLHGKTYKVLTPPCKNYYYNGFWKYSIDYSGAVAAATKPAYNDNVVMEYGSVHANGSGTTGRNYCILNDSKVEDLWKTNLKNVVAIGEDTLTKTIEEHDNHVSDFIAIGRGVMSAGNMHGNSGHNIGIGQHALHALTTGDRNIAIGSLAMQFSTTATKTIAIGRDAGQTLIGGTQNVVIGYQALSGCGWSAGSTYLEPQNAVSPIHCTFVGSHAGCLISGTPRRATVLGSFSLTNAKSISNSTIIGSHNAELVGYDKSVNQKNYVNYTAISFDVGVSATCVFSAHTIFIDPANTTFLSDVSVGMVAVVDIPGVDENEYVITSVSSTRIKVYISDTSMSGMRDVPCEIVQIKGIPREATYVAANSEAVITPTLSAMLSDVTVNSYVFMWFDSLGDNIVKVIGKTDTTFTVELSGSAIDGTSGDAKIYGCEGSTDIGYSDKTVNRTIIAGELTFNKASNLFGVTAVGSQCAGKADAVGEFARTEIIGYLAGQRLASATSSFVAGSYAGSAADTALNAAIVGPYADKNASYPRNSVSIGYEAGVKSGVSYNNVFVGSQTGNCLAGSTDADEPNDNCRRNTAVGYQAMYQLVDGTTSTTGVHDSTAVGSFAYVSGSNQVQLGGSGTTVYAYGSVQDRSDARDKADIRDTELGLDFLLSLRPVDFKWDMRDDYIETVERDVEEVGSDGVAVTRTVADVVAHEKDGSKKRTRYHHGLIAQEVKAVLDEKGIDFGGYQDHKINGGCDVLTLGYEEFVAPIIKALQEIDARLKALEA